MSRRIEITLPQQEYSALLDISIDDLRIPADEIRFILRKEIERRSDKSKNLELERKIEKKIIKQDN